MRKFIVFAAACLFACSFLLIVQPASAATAWERVGDDVFTIELNYLYSFGDSDSFGIYDFDNPGNTLEVMNSLDNTGSVVQKTLEFSITGGIYSVALDGGTPLDMGTSDEFGFYFNDALDYAKLETGTNAWKLTFSEGPEVFVTNANPVPIPTAVFLFGSGLVGLVGFRRKTKE